MSDYDSPSPPETANKLPVLYSFRRCPYAMRARMALRYAGQNCVLREVDLKHKPESMLQASRKGTVPVMLVESSVIDESLDVMLWALRQNDPDNWLEKGDMQPGVKELVATNDGTFKEHLDGYKYAGRDGQAAAESHRQQGESFLSELEALLAQDGGRQHLLGEQLTFVDVALMPFIRQFANVDTKWFEASRYVNLRGWLERLIRSPLFVSIMTKRKPWQAGDPVTYLY
ncbi:MAG: glutathione S-transferase [Pseudomonadaceae bacterium]|nr:glutathione S-transferase [Pseudomonadaceae bacterium]